LLQRSGGAAGGLKRFVELRLWVVGELRRGVALTRAVARELFLRFEPAGGMSTGGGAK
jgi:hypothetical protein